MIIGSQQYVLNERSNSKVNSGQEQLQENLGRLSNLMSNQPPTVKKIYVQMHGYLRSPSAHLTQQTRDTPASKLRTSGQTYFDKNSERMGGTQTYTLKKSLLNVTNECFENSNLNQTGKTKSYNSWVGLSVIERNKIFLEKKQKKLKVMKEQKEEEEISQCTFAPAFFNPIRVERNQSCQVNRSYQDIHLQKKLHNSRLY